jgi:hypothetical protein
VPTPTFGLLCRGPYAIIGKLVGLDTNIFLANGDSLMAGGTTDASNQNGARANIGYFPIGMDDSTGIGSIPFGMFAVGSTNMDAISPANYALRERMLREVGYPFDDHVTNHVNNSVTGQGPDILNQRRMKSYSYMRQMRHVGKRPPRIIQITPNPLAQETDATKQWTDPATQSVTAPNALPDGERWVVRDMILANKGNDDHVDVTPYWADTTFPDRWKAPGRIYTVVSDVSSGVVLRITGSIRPRQGDFMIVGVGASGWVRKTIGAVADVTPGSVWDVTSATGQTAYAPTVVAGTAVAMALTSDGIHDGSPGNEDASAAIIAAKNSGILS